jgi:predicted small integral membrane protein
MWQSQTWNANETVGRMFVIVGVTRLFVNAVDDET